MHTPGRPVTMGVAGRRVPGALLVPDQDVAHAARVEQRVIGGQDRPAGDAEDDVDAQPLQRGDQCLRTGDQCRLVAGGGLGVRGGRAVGPRRAASRAAARAARSRGDGPLALARRPRQPGP